MLRDYRIRYRDKNYELIDEEASGYDAAEAIVSLMTRFKVTEVIKVEFLGVYRQEGLLCGS